MNYAAELFHPHLNTPFFIQFQDKQQTELLLEEVKNQSSVNSSFHQFSLFFTGPHTDQLGQGTYTLTHASLPEHAIFLVPVAKTEHGYRYQACFNIKK
ncbi:DUF6916 family protein [Solimicrobium silvestre]|uniref:DUF6916 domain-containing protein n=1 Tax=Solimicrobium silvestre TaxID=2099400 RepID=A0A2S9H4W6_9BURK|nr:hypothetical protein [Solimicrobium silvestre]PRC95008.1 hypothetical protein S2091_0203 [Solimicrobium silvestre]